MNADWKKLETDLAAIKRVAAALRERCGELDFPEIERLLAPLRGCMVELIALRSSLEKTKSERAGKPGAQ